MVGSVKRKRRNNIMSYIQDTLLKDEQIVYYTRPHFVVFYTVFIWLVLAVFMGKFMGSTMLGVVMLVMGLISFVGDLISYYCSEYVITSRRILMKVGFIRRKSLEIFLDRVEGVYVEQGIMGRVFNFGTVIIAGVGGTKNPFFFIPTPLKFRSAIQSQMQKGDGK
jgi:uncharacterized membrane protein YdbT with pleckstrin-like domain